MAILLVILSLRLPEGIVIASVYMCLCVRVRLLPNNLKNYGTDSYEI